MSSIPTPIAGKSGHVLEVDGSTSSIRTRVYDDSGNIAQVHNTVNGLKTVTYGNSGTPIEVNENNTLKIAIHDGTVDVGGAAAVVDGSNNALRTSLRNSSGTAVEINSNSNALRVVLYNSDGTVFNPGAGTSYMQSWNNGISSAGSPSSGSSLFHIRNDPNSAINFYVKKIRIDISTVLAPLTLQLVDLELIRTSAANMSGGTAVTAANCGRKDTQYANPSISDFRYSTNMAALTTTSVVFGQQLSTFNAVAAAGNRFETIHTFDDDNRPLILRPGEGLAIRNITAISGLMTWALKGEICWDER